MIISENKIYPCSNDRETIYLKNVIIVFVFQLVV